MSSDSSFVIDDFLSTYLNVFSVDDFCHYMKTQGERITKSQGLDILNTSPYVFSLVNEEYITRAGVFTGRWFSFKPTKEEIRKGYIILGHRCMPFVNPNISPDKIQLKVGKKIVFPFPSVFSMNTAMDVFALYGEGYVIPYIFGDMANTTTTISSTQYNMPTEVKLTSWPIKQIAGSKGIRYGDRFLCRVVDWNQNIVEISVLRAEQKDAISKGDIQREEWYPLFEKGLLNSFDKNGPGDSIEEQLAFLFLENQQELCIENCGSAEEFLQHTKKIGFSYYGVESRIWRVGEQVPFIGKWNEEFSAEALFSNVSMIFFPQIIDGYIENFLYEQTKYHSKKTIDELLNEIFPTTLKMSPVERKAILLNIEKRHDIIKKNYNQFSEHKIAPIRKKVMSLFSQVSSLLCAIVFSGLKLDVFPQQELVMLTQLFKHIGRIIEEMENEFLRDRFPIDDVALSLEGMEDTFDDISVTLTRSLEVNTYKNIKIVP